MLFLISDAASHSFPADPVGCKPVVLIDACVAKIRHCYARTSDGQFFFNGAYGVEKRAKLDKARNWITDNNSIWAPVIDVRSPDVRNLFIADGRHTFVALEEAGFTCIRVVVPADRAPELQVLLQCD